MLLHVISLLVPYATVGIGLYLFHNAWIAILSYHAAMLCVIFLSKPKPAAKQLFTSHNVKIPLVLAVMGMGGGLLLYFLSPTLGIADDIGRYTRSIGLTEQTWLPFIIYYVLVNPFIEEYYWRGLLAGGQSSRIIAADLFFAGYHILVLAGKLGAIWLPVVFIILSLAAWLWRYLNNLSGGLLPSVLCHLTADVSVISAIYWIAVHR